MIPLRRTAIALAAALSLVASLAACSSPAPDEERTPREGREVVADSGRTEQAERSEAQDPSTETSAQESATTCSDGTPRRTVLLTGTQKTGEWGGTIIEPHGARYDLRASLSDDGCSITGTFQYIGLGCSGTWTSENVELVDNNGTGLQNAVRANFTERVTADPQQACAPEAQVSLLNGPAGMFYWSNWVRSDGEATDSRTHLDRL